VFSPNKYMWTYTIISFVIQSDLHVVSC